jgi:hypothetical protein
MVDESSRFSRRRMLKAGLFGAAAVAVGSALLATQSTRTHTPHGQLRVLSAQEYAVLSAVAARILPGSERAPSGEALRVSDTIDALFADKEPDVQKGLKLSLVLLENALSGALFGERITPFTKLSPQGQDDTLRAFRASRLAVRRSIFVGLNALVSAVYFGDPRSFSAIDYPGPPDPEALRLANAENLVDLAALRAPK